MIFAQQEQNLPLVLQGVLTVLLGPSNQLARIGRLAR